MNRPWIYRLIASWLSVLNREAADDRLILVRVYHWKWCLAQYFIKLTGRFFGTAVIARLLLFCIRNFPLFSATIDLFLATKSTLTILVPDETSPKYEIREMKCEMLIVTVRGPEPNYLTSLVSAICVHAISVRWPGGRLDINHLVPKEKETGISTLTQETAWSPASWCLFCWLETLGLPSKSELWQIVSRIYSLLLSLIL